MAAGSLERVGWRGRQAGLFDGVSAIRSRLRRRCPEEPARPCLRPALRLARDDARSPEPLCFSESHHRVLKGFAHIAPDIADSVRVGRRANPLVG